MNTISPEEVTRQALLAEKEVAHTLTPAETTELAVLRGLPAGKTQEQFLRLLFLVAKNADALTPAEAAELVVLKAIVG